MSPVIEIGNCLVSSEILTEKFACDYPVCHGVCCIIGDSGAPLEKEECSLLKGEYDKFRNELRDEGIRSIEEQGPFVLDSDGDLVTPLINGEECAYTLFDNSGNCFCANADVAHKARIKRRNFIRPPKVFWINSDRRL